MSMDLSFWRYNGEPTKKHSEVYALLSNGNEVEGLEELPITNILQSLENALASWNRLDETHFEKNDEVIEVYTTSQFVRFDCYGVSNENMNLLIDVMLQYDCPLYDSSIDVRFDERMLSLEEASDYYFSRMVELLAVNGFKRQNKYTIRRKIGTCIQEVMVTFQKRRGEDRGDIGFWIKLNYEAVNRIAHYLWGEKYRKEFGIVHFSSSPWYHKDIHCSQKIYGGISENAVEEMVLLDYKNIVEVFLPEVDNCDTLDKFYGALERDEIDFRCLTDRIKEWIQIAILLVQGKKEEALEFYDNWEPYYFSPRRAFTEEEKQAARMRIESWEKE